MVLINCACCAAPLPHPAKQCSRCKTLYCSPACQKQHWEQGGHDKLCRKIRKGGGAEQYHADIKFKEAVAVAADAAEAFKEDAKGQKCYICGDDKEGLVRMCACCGTAGFAHVSCLAEQAKILVAEAEENNLGPKAWNERWVRWEKCSLCEQKYHGVVCCALGWACWKMYLGRPEADFARKSAMTYLGNGLAAVNNYEDALTVGEAELSMEQRLGAPEASILTVMGNLSQTYNMLGREEDSLRMMRDIYFGSLKLYGENGDTLLAANNYAMALTSLRRCKEAKELLRKTTPVARRVLGENDQLMLHLRTIYATASYYDPDATLGDLRESVKTLEDTARIARRVMGGGHPFLGSIERDLGKSRTVLSAHEAGKSVVFEPEES